MSEKKLMAGKVILVTGAGRGIGRDIAIMAAEQGAKVVVNDVGVSVAGEGNDASPANEVVTEIRAAGGQAIADFNSVAESAGAQAMVAAAIKQFGQLDSVVNNAGILRDRIFHRMSDEEWDAVLKVHLYGSYNVSRAAADHYRERQQGCFVHMTSTSGLIGNFGQANYAAAKMGIVGLSKSIALDMMRYNVRSNCISPFAWSRMVGSIPDTPDQKQRLEKLKSLKTTHIAAVAVFLASEAAKEISGQIFAVRGSEVFLMSQPRPIRSLHRAGGWTPETLAEQLTPAFKSSFYPLERSGEVFNWDPPA